MSDSIWPWIVLAVIVIAVIALLAFVMKQRRTEVHRAEAAELQEGELPGHDVDHRADDYPPGDGTPR